MSVSGQAADPSGAAVPFLPLSTQTPGPPPGFPRSTKEKASHPALSSQLDWQVSTLAAEADCPTDSGHHPWLDPSATTPPGPATSSVEHDAVPSPALLPAARHRPPAGSTCPSPSSSGSHLVSQVLGPARSEVFGGAWNVGWAPGRCATDRLNEHFCSAAWYCQTSQRSLPSPTQRSRHSCGLEMFLFGPTVPCQARAS